jgi:hypothetical protein
VAERTRSCARAAVRERANAISGVPAAKIRRAARLYAAGPSMIVHGLGMTEHRQGTDGISGLVNLALLTGNLGRPGSGVNPLRGQNNVQGAAQMGCEPEILTGGVSLERGRAAFEKAWNAPLPRTKGLRLLDMIDAALDGRLKALVVVGYDILLTNPLAGSRAVSVQRRHHDGTHRESAAMPRRHARHRARPRDGAQRRHREFCSRDQQALQDRDAGSRHGLGPAWRPVRDLPHRRGVREPHHLKTLGTQSGRRNTRSPPSASSRTPDELL